MVAPPWDLPPKPPCGATVIVINPSRGFGTGHHASTRLCLRALSDLDVSGRRVVDLGTGSGVLAMAAALKGARDVLAVDVDQDAIDSARQSAALNRGVDRVEWLVDDFRTDNWVAAHGGPWPIVLANLTGGMLMQSAAHLREIIAPGGVLIASGFDVTERAGVLGALGMDSQTSFEEDGWVGVTLRRG
jgi:ribosomal protein L11 methyltransferase